MPVKYAIRVVPTLAFLASRKLSQERAAFEDMTFLRHIITGDSPSPEYSGF